jgi:putative ABC transport system permease protein
MVSYSVSSRLREIGVRLALGAAPGGILRFVVGEGLRLGVLGVAVGVPAAFAAGHLTRSLLDAATVDPWILAAAGTLMLAATSLAAYLPARRASAVDPVVVLRHE